MKNESPLWLAALMLFFMLTGQSTPALICAVGLFLRNQLSPSPRREASSSPCEEQSLILRVPCK
jgi:hypothetical protein